MADTVQTMVLPVAMVCCCSRLTVLAFILILFETCDALFCSEQVTLWTVVTASMAAIVVTAAIEAMMGFVVVRKSKLFCSVKEVCVNDVILCAWLCVAPC